MSDGCHRSVCILSACMACNRYLSSCLGVTMVCIPTKQPLGPFTDYMSSCDSGFSADGTDGSRCRSKYVWSRC